MSVIDEILNGAIDMHVHNGPDAAIERRMDSLQLAEYGYDLGLRAIVLKNRNYCTCAAADTVNQLVPDITLFGSLCLDYECGGINASAVESAAKSGAKVIWMPTLSSTNSMLKAAKQFGMDTRKSGIDIMSDAVQSELDAILGFIKDYDIILATGHISPEEIFFLVEKAVSKGISKIVITHPLTRGPVDKYLEIDDQIELSRKGAIIEHCFLDVMPPVCEIKAGEIAQAIKTVGAQRCIMSTDFGQVHNPPAPEGLRLFIGSMLKCGITREEIELMVKSNPAILLGLE